MGGGHLTDQNFETPSGQYAPTQQGPQYTPQHQPQFQQGPGQHGPGLGEYSQQPGQYSQQSGQYGQQPGQYSQQSIQYGQQPGYPPAQANPQQVDAYKQLLQETVQQKSLQSIYPPNHPALDRYAQRAATQTDQLWKSLNIPPELGRDLVKLALFDVILYIGKSLGLT
ncbi:MAG: hypothetical protein Q9198_009369 [Flavoplaca austrocitrina]